MFVSSGGRTDVARRRVSANGINPLFRSVQGSDESPRGVAKGPGHYAIFARLLDMSVADLCRKAWLIGDGPYDMQVAHEAGTWAIGRLTGDNGNQLMDAGADDLISDLRGLQALLKTTASEK